MKEKSAKVQSMPIKMTNCIWIFVSLGRASILFVKKIARDIMSNVVLSHAALVAKEEHFINLFLIILL